MAERAWREASIDLSAITRNVQHLRSVTRTEHFIAVVKADAYGHGAVQSARAALAGGADWLGVADVGEALELRNAGIDAPILAWLHDPIDDFAVALAARVSVGISSSAQLRAVADAAGRAGGPAASVQLKLDTGLSRNGIPEPQWEHVFEAARELEHTAPVRVDGIFSHVSNASVADDEAAVGRFDRGLELAAQAGLAPSLTHIAATTAALTVPTARYNAVRIGIGMYGLSPLEGRSSADLGLTPAMTLRSRVAGVRSVPADTGVSYGYTYRTDADTTLALIPLGYADGIPRGASNGGPVQIGGRIFRVSGRVAMDQFVVDVGEHPVAVGDEAVLFGDPAQGMPSAEQWAAAADTINYEIIARIGGRVTRTYVGG
ncbi:alanine racemase [Rathayibacter soli]|uniref:alanine racemase n=1 Tax=Rathayibacter soli TaxID=3144168 RepID=UPI0027E464A2|nr:alanine racemase [Glaciibacter superstes]